MSNTFISLESAYDASAAAVRVVLVDTGVIDQLLRGNSDVYGEIQALQDYEIQVHRRVDDGDDSDEIRRLRRLVSSFCDIFSPPAWPDLRLPWAPWFHPPIDTANPAITAALENVGYVFQPHIHLRASDEVLTVEQAAELASSIGAAPPNASLDFAEGTAALTGLK